MTVLGLDLVSLIVMLISASTPILLAATGELVAEKSGVLNLGVEGMMIMGAIAGFAAAVMTGSPAAGYAMAAVAGAGMAMIFAFLTQVLMANQVASGLALTLFGLGLSALIGQPFNGVKPPAMPGAPFAALADLPVIGPILFSHDWVVYASLALLAGVWLFLRSRPGLILRAVGENPDAAHALGYRVIAIRIAALAFGGALAGMGGAYLSLVRVPQWAQGMTAGAGWIALAIVVFAAWRPGGILLGAYLFGGVTVLQLRLQAAGFAIPVQFLAMTPYLVTIIVLVIMSARQKQGSAAPAALGRPFLALR
ncbi:ABC transporter permease [Paracoccus sp. p4-l81]|uniref:ABC transporter permease n=1 Tax=unclassified Paracoccus (in: a-proteobacteria) TaxID=2688777 RepID=UPI0035B7145A